MPQELSAVRLHGVGAAVPGVLPALLSAADPLVAGSEGTQVAGDARNQQR